MFDFIISIEELLSKYNVTKESGHTASKAEELLSANGENILQGKKPRSVIQKFFDQLKDYMVIILLLAAAISFLVALTEPEGEFIDSIIILAIVILNAILGVQQESKAEKALDALKDMSAPTAKVIRDNIVSEIPSSKIVVGDIVLLEAGDFIPADGRIIESASLKCEESALTGESVPVEKDADAIVSENAGIGDRINMVYSGCSVTYGRAKIIITSTGMKTEMGKIAELLDNELSETTPLQQKLNQLGKYLGILAVLICTVIFAVGMLQNIPAMEMFMTSVSLAVASIPEGLTAVVTVVLAIGVQNMVKKNAIIRRLPAVETLGSASVICSDKTGTLTQNRMTVQSVWSVGEEISPINNEMPKTSSDVIRFGTLCNDGQLVKEGEEIHHIGDPTETAIVAAALEIGMEKSTLDVEYERIAEIPFDSDRKLMSTVHRMDGKIIVAVKGGYDVLLKRCVGADVAAADIVNNTMAEKAMRVLAVAYKEISECPSEVTSENLENGLTFLGLIGMIDPPREESKQAVAVCKEAGIKTVMITGDHIMTAAAIAKEIGILSENDKAITGHELSLMSEEELIKNIEDYRVYARVSPEDKIRIVKAWQKHGAVVAMTGDGVNDAPALKAADIGCAMGITGTDVAKGAADMVLTDDNFSTIVEAVRSGRGIFSNITKTIQFLLGSNLGEVVTVFFAMIFGWGSPLLAIHLLLVNVITDALPALALGMEKVDDDIMKKLPIPKNQGIFANGLGFIIGLYGFMVGIITLTGYYIGSFVELSPLFPASREVGMTMAFLVLALSQLTNAYNCRSTHSVFKIGVFSNSSMNKAFIGSFVIVMLIYFVPFLAEIFEIVPLSGMHWGLVGFLAFSPLIIVEIIKFVLGKKESI